MKDRLGRMGQAALAPHSPGQRSGNPWARAALPEEKPGLDYIKNLPSSRWGRIGHLKTIFWLWKTPDITRVSSKNCQEPTRVERGQPSTLGPANFPVQCHMGNNVGRVGHTVTVITT